MYFVLCSNQQCNKSNECFRYMCEPDETASYQPFTDICEKKNKYRMFINIKKGDKIKNVETKVLTDDLIEK